MAAEVKLMGGIGYEIGGDGQDDQRRPVIRVQVGKAPALRSIELTEEDVIGLIRDGARVLEVMRVAREREAERRG